MQQSQESQPKSESPAREEENLGGAALPGVDPSNEDRSQELWAEYRLQQKRRSCPGCGDDGAVF